MNIIGQRKYINTIFDSCFSQERYYKANKLSQLESEFGLPILFSIISTIPFPTDEVRLLIMDK